MAEHGYLPEYDEDRRRDEERDRGFMFEDRDRARSHSDDAHYLSWRDRHMRELDRDYAEYRRERELHFRRDFDAWRRERSNPPPLQAGMTQTATPTDELGTLELRNEGESPAEGGSDPMAAATLGTTSSDDK